MASSTVFCDTITAIYYIKDDFFFDLNVPVHENYLANDIWNHNCGLGKTPQLLVWAQNVVMHTNRPVLVLTPLAVSGQTVREADKFGVDAQQSRDGKFSKKIVVTNYEKLHLFDPADFCGVVCDESSCIANFDAKRTAAVTEFMRTLPYRLLCTATAAPNDYIELGTSAETLGEMGYSDMITRFFKQQKKGGNHAWNRDTYYLRPHAARDFWRWVCSWSRACRKPSDLGFDDGKFLLPPLTTTEHVIQANKIRPGFLFDMPAVTLEEQGEERRRTIKERCEKVAELLSHDRPGIAWCRLNPEGDLLEKLIPGSVQISGSDSDEAKEEKILAFVSGQYRVLVSKPQIVGYGLNLQHCAHMTFFPSHSFQQYYQAVRRCWRFGQSSPVQVDVVTTAGGRVVLANLQRKAENADEMFANLVRPMNDHLNIARSNPFTQKAGLPSWLQH